MSKFDRRLVVTAQTMIWQRDREGIWNKTLIREQGKTKAHLSDIISVTADVPVCMCCLSTNVAVMDSEKYDGGELFCYECGVQYGFIL